MKKELKIALIILLGLLVIVGVILSSLQLKYLDFKNNVIGKTSAEIQERYGEFDNFQMHPGADGLFRNTSCSYVVIRECVGFLGTTPPYVISIGFDSNGVAYRVFLEQGGFGG